MEKTKNTRGWAIVAVSFLLLMLVFASCISCMGVYLKPVTEEFGISRTSFSLVTTIQALAMLLSAMFAGKMLEKYNIKLIMTIGIAAGSVCFFIYAIAPNITYFYVASLLMGICISFTCNIPVSILIKNWFKNGNEGFALGLAFVGSGIGSMLLNPLYTYIITNYGWRTSFVVTGIAIAVILIPLILFVVTRGPEEIDSKVHSDESNDPNDFTLSEAIRKPQTWLMFITLVCLTFACMGILNHGVPYMTDSGMSAEKAAMVISVASGILIVGKIAAGALYDKIGVYKMNLIEAVLLTMCFIAFLMVGLTGAPIAIGLFILLYGIGVPFATICMQLILPLMFGRSHFASIMGMFSMANGIGGMLQVVISMIYDKTGSYYPAWIMMIILCVFMITMFAICVKPQKKAA